MRKIIFVFLACFVLFSCATTKNSAPDWVLNPTSVYSDSEYLSAVGTGIDRLTAENAAVAALTRIVKQNVKSETTASEQFATAGNDVVSSRDTFSTVKTTSDIVISGIQVKDVWLNTAGKKTEFYALALINRKEAGTFYKSKIQELTSVINSKIQNGYANFGTFAAYATLKEASILAEECDYYLDILGVVNPTMYKICIPDYGNAAAIKDLATNCLQKTVVAIQIEGDQNGRIEAAFSTILKDYGIRIANVGDTDATYTLIGDASFTPLEMSSESKNKFIRFVLNASLTEVKSGKNVLPFSVSGREAHLSESEATQRAVRTIENEIRLNFRDKFDSLF